MKRTLLLSLATATLLPAQDATPAATPPALTSDQVNNVLKQLAELEKSIMQQRNASLGGIIQRLHTAASSDAAAINFIEECDKLVNVERKDGDKKDELRIKQKAEQAKRGETKKEEDKDGDHATGLRLGLEYLALTLEAHETKDLTTMIPKVQAFHQSLITHGKKLKGRTGDLIMQPIARAGAGPRRGGAGGGDIGLVIEAYQLDAFLRREGWPLEPGNIIGMYDKLILVSVRAKKSTELGSGWDNAINTEISFRKERMTEGEFSVWQQQEFPNLRWQRAQDLVKSSGNPVSGMAEMLKVIKEFPNHPSSPVWINELRTLVSPAEPAATTAAQ